MRAKSSIRSLVTDQARSLTEDPRSVPRDRHDRERSSIAKEDHYSDRMDGLVRLQGVRGRPKQRQYAWPMMSSERLAYKDSQ